MLNCQNSTKDNISVGVKHHRDNKKCEYIQMKKILQILSCHIEPKCLKSSNRKIEKDITEVS